MLTDFSRAGSALGSNNRLLKIEMCETQLDPHTSLNLTSYTDRMRVLMCLYRSVFILINSVSLGVFPGPPAFWHSAVSIHTVMFCSLQTEALHRCC